MKITASQTEILYALLRKLCRLRDGNFCLKCERLGRKDKDDPNGVILHLSHIHPKGIYRGMEFEPDNVKLLCFKCHFHWWHKNPIEAGEWIKKVLPEKRYERLKLMTQTYQGGKDFNMMKLYIESEIKKLIDTKRFGW